MQQDSADYKYVTGPQERRQLAAWRDRLALISIFSSALFVPIGIVFACLSAAFHIKSRDKGAFSPIAAFAVMPTFILVHLWLVNLLVSSQF